MHRIEPSPSPTSDGITQASFSPVPLGVIDADTGCHARVKAAALPGARWYEIEPQPSPDYGTLWPCLGPVALSPVGRPRDPVVTARGLAAAALFDLASMSLREIAQTPTYTEDPTGAPEVRARDDRNAGRRRLHDAGVLPWCVFASGRLPDEWWRSEAFAEGMRRWRLAALESPQPGPDLSDPKVARLRRALRDSLAASRDRMRSAPVALDRDSGSVFDTVESVRRALASTQRTVDIMRRARAEAEAHWQFDDGS